MGLKMKQIVAWVLEDKKKELIKANKKRNYTLTYNYLQK
jgi:hypothetical protein